MRSAGQAKYGRSASDAVLSVEHRAGSAGPRPSPSCYQWTSETVNLILTDLTDYSTSSPLVLSDTLTVDLKPSPEVLYWPLGLKLSHTKKNTKSEFIFVLFEIFFVVWRKIIYYFQITLDTLFSAMTSSVEPLEITGNELVHILRTPRDQYTSAGCVVLDCRPFLDFSFAHICESRNVYWNSMLRRRSKSSVVALEWLIPDKSLLARLRRGEFSPVVVVDESSRSLTELKAESVAQMLISALHNEVQTQICFLQGNTTL